MAAQDGAQVVRDLLAEQPFLLAPMAGVTDAAYRIMCRRRGARLAYSEMVSVAGLAYASNKTWRLVLPEDEEPQICVQLFGSKPEQFASAVEAVQERVGDKLTLIDINMACPARKVITKGEGSALMETPELAEDSIYRYLEEDLGIKIGTGTRDVTVEHPTKEDRRCLDLGDFDSLAVVRGKTYRIDGTLMEYTETKQVPSFFALHETVLRSGIPRG